MKKYRIWVEPGGHQKGLTHKEQVRRIFEGFRGISDVADFRFTQVFEQFKSDRRIYFRSNKWMLNKGGSGKIPYGMFLKPKSMVFNSERAVKYDAPGSWQVQQLTQHEWFHSLPNWVQYDGDYRHSNDETSIAHIAGRANGPNPQDVYKLQRYAGKPRASFYPRSKSLVGAEVRRLTSEWVYLRNKRNAEASKAKRKALTTRVLATFSKLMYTRSEWSSLRDQWRNVPKAL